MSCKAYCFNSSSGDGVEVGIGVDVGVGCGTAGGVEVARGIGTGVGSSVEEGVGAVDGTGAAVGIDVGVGNAVGTELRIGRIVGDREGVALGVGVYVGCAATVRVSFPSLSKLSNSSRLVRIENPINSTGTIQSRCQKLHHIFRGLCGPGGLVPYVGGRLGGCGGRRHLVAVRAGRRRLDRLSLPSLHRQHVHAVGCSPYQFGLLATYPPCCHSG